MLCSPLTPAVSCLSWSQPPCPRGMLLLQRSGGVSQLHDVADVSVRYLCRGDVGPPPGPPPPADSASRFASGQLNTSDCRIDNVTSAFVCGGGGGGGGGVSSTPPPSFPPCNWDDGYRWPPKPSFDLATNTCVNAVVGVDYEFTWDGTRVSRLDAVLVLANIPWHQAAPLVRQDFSVRFSHETNGSETNVTLRRRSGKPGGKQCDRGTTSVLKSVAIIGNVIGNNVYFSGE